MPVKKISNKQATNTHLQIKKTFLIPIYLDIRLKQRKGSCFMGKDFYHFLFTGEPECLEGDFEGELE